MAGKYAAAEKLFSEAAALAYKEKDTRDAYRQLIRLSGISQDADIALKRHLRQNPHTPPPLPMAYAGREKELKRLRKQGWLAIISLILAIFFLSPNLTGFSILSIQLQASNYLGLIFLLIGIVIFFISKRK